MKKIINVALAMVASITLIQCNDALEGFNAPEGSTIEYITPPGQYQVCEGAELLIQLTMIVRTPNSLSGALQPSEKIFGQISSNGPTRLYIKKDTAEVLSPFETEVTRVEGDNLTFTTDNRGIYEVVIGIPGVPPGQNVLDTVLTTIGVDTQPFLITVTCLQVQ